MRYSVWQRREIGCGKTTPLSQLSLLLNSFNEGAFLERKWNSIKIKDHTWCVSFFLRGLDLIYSIFVSRARNWFWQNHFSLKSVWTLLMENPTHFWHSASSVYLLDPIRGMPLLVVQPLYKWIGQNPLWSKILIYWYSFCQKHNQPIFRKPLDPSSTSHQVCWRSQIPVVCALLFKKNHLKIFPELVWLRFRILCLLKNHTSIGFWHFSGDGCWEKDEVLFWKRDETQKSCK